MVVSELTSQSIIVCCLSTILKLYPVTDWDDEQSRGNYG